MVGGDQRVQSQCSNRRRRVQHDKVEVRPDADQSLGEEPHTVGAGVELDRST